MMEKNVINNIRNYLPCDYFCFCFVYDTFTYFETVKIFVSLKNIVGIKLYLFKR